MESSLITPSRRARRQPRRLLSLLLGVLCGVCLLGSFGATRASAADNTLAGSSPAADSTVPTSPTSIQLSFTAPLGTLNVVGLNCSNVIPPVGTPQLGADGLSLTVAVPEALPKGTCRVAWTVSQPDGRPGGSGSFAFVVEADAATATTAAVAQGGTTAADDATAADTGSGNDSSSNGPLGVLRLLSTLSLAILFGAVAVISLAWPEGVEYILTVRFLRISFYVALATTWLFVGYLASEDSGRSFGASLVPTTWGDLADTTPGVAGLIRLLFVAATAWVVIRPERIIDPASQLIALPLPGIAVATLGFSRPLGDMAALGAVAGIVHALAMAIWFGGLVLLARVVLAGPGESDLVHAVRGFIRLSTPAIVATVLSGAVQTYRLDRGSLFDTSHGYVLLLKVLAVMAMVFVGFASRQFIRQRLQDAESMPAALATRLRRAVGFEAIAGALVLVLTSWLLALTPAHLEAAAGGTRSDFGDEQVIRNDELVVEVRISFTQVVGPNAVRVEVAEMPLPYTGLEIDFTPPEGSGVGAVELVVPLTCLCTAELPLSEGLRLDAPGNWTVSVKVNDVEIGSRNVAVSLPAGTASPTT